MFVQAIIGASLLVSVVSGADNSTSGSVGFSAGLGENKTVPGGQVVIFDEVRTNLGGGYDKITGVFTAPKDGLYVFQIHALTTEEDDLWLKLFQNEQYIFSVFARQRDDYDAASNSAVLQLKEGDKVYVKAHRDANLYGAEDDIYCTFSGYLISLLATSQDT